MAKIGVVGTGYVGLTSSVCFAELGHSVIGMDIDESKINKLLSGISTIHEENLESLLNKNLNSKNLTFTNKIGDLQNCDFIFLCVPTPQDEDGSADLSYVIEATKNLIRVMKDGSILVTKSTVPIKAWEKINKIVDSKDITIVSNPEFLREGSAVNDFFHPERIVVGSKDEKKSKKVVDLYKNLTQNVLITDNTSAELTKYAANSFLAIKLSFVNEIAALCDEVGANALDVLKGMGYDSRIGEKFLSPGPGWGGSCFPKDVRALAVSADENAVHMALLQAAIESNEKAHRRIVDKVEKNLGGNLAGKKVGIWGLTFKANTDDLRESPAIEVVKRLIGRGAVVTAYDPMVQKINNLKIEIVKNISDPIASSEALVVLTEWDEFKNFDPASLLSKNDCNFVIDSRNILNKNNWEEAGFTYIGNGI
jgi:UDPglucose 6-dehydrogenase